MDPDFFALEGNEVRLNESFVRDHPWIESIAWMPGHARFIETIHNSSHAIIARLDTLLNNINNVFTILDCMRHAALCIVIYRLLTESSPLLATPPIVSFYVEKLLSKPIVCIHRLILSARLC
jgi:hypothetical protein